MNATPEPADNAVFPTPWQYDIALHTNDGQDSRVTVTDHSGYEFASFEGDCEGAHRFIESAYVMEESHRIRDAAKLVLSRWETGDLAEAVRALAEVIADTERA